MSVSEKIKNRIEADGGRYWAGDNISRYIQPEEIDPLIDELNAKFDAVLDSLIIDRRTDPNSMGTGRRLAKIG